MADETIRANGIDAALLAAQRVMPDPPRSGQNPHFRSAYVTLDDLLDTALPVLNEHDVYLSQAATIRDGEDVLETMLIHAPSGQFRASTTRLYMSKTDSQAQGSAITYARRYAIMALLALVGEDDDDGNAASRPAAQESRPSGAPDSPTKRGTFDPGRQLLSHAIAVKGEADATAIELAQRDLWPEQDWGLERQRLIRHLFGKPESELTPTEWGEWWRRIANAIVNAQDASGSQEFVKPEHVVAAYAWAFKGYELELAPLPEATGGDETPAEDAPEVSDTPEAEEPEEAS